VANTLYDLGRKAFADAGIAWLSADIKVVLCSSGYSPNTATDQYLSDIAGGNRVATSANLASKTSTTGACDAADLTFTAVSGAQVLYIVVYKDTGVASSSPLICIFDTATNLPVTPNGGDITIQFDNGTNKIFKL
jgi:hypothetical protein